MLDGDSSWWDEFEEWMKQWEEYLRLGGEDLLTAESAIQAAASPQGVQVGVSEETVRFLGLLSMETP